MHAWIRHLAVPCGQQMGSLAAHLSVDLQHRQCMQAVGHQQHQGHVRVGYTGKDHL